MSEMHVMEREEIFRFFLHKNYEIKWGGVEELSRVLLFVFEFVIHVFCLWIENIIHNQGNCMMDDNKVNMETFAIFQHWEQQILRNWDMIEFHFIIIHRRLISSLPFRNDNTILVNLIRVARQSWTVLEKNDEFDEIIALQPYIWWSLNFYNDLIFDGPKWAWLWIWAESCMHQIKLLIDSPLPYALLGCGLLGGGPCAVDKLTSFFPILQKNETEKIQ